MKIYEASNDKESICQRKDFDIETRKKDERRKNHRVKQVRNKVN